jgi:serine O-acetyltransferase
VARGFDFEAMGEKTYPKNPHIRNGRVADLYLFYLRRKWRIPAKLIGYILNCQIGCAVPERLFMPHPFGIIVNTQSRIGNDVVLLQQVTLGIANPYYHPADPPGLDPILMDGVFVGTGAKILGHITIGEWSVIGANAVVTTDIPAYSIVVGYNRILDKRSTELSLR